MGRVGARLADYWRTRNGIHLDTFQVPVGELAPGNSVGDYAKLFSQHAGRRVHKWTHYAEAYHEEFANYRAGFPTADGSSSRPLKFLEIGVQHGGSLQLWREYFGPDAEIWGIDIDPRCLAITDPDLNIRIGSQDDSTFLLDVVAQMGGVDLVLDDGSHMAKHQLKALRTLFPVLSPGGLYAVEDVHTSYWRDYGGGYQRSKSFVNVAKGLVDDMHGHYHTRGDRVGLDARNNIPRIAFYDSMIFIRKGSRRRPAATEIGTPSF